MDEADIFSSLRLRNLRQREEDLGDYQESAAISISFMVAHITGETVLSVSLFLFFHFFCLKKQQAKNEKTHTGTRLTDEMQNTNIRAQQWMWCDHLSAAEE